MTTEEDQPYDVETRYRVGRPSKIGDPAIRARLLQAFRIGAPHRIACSLALLSVSTFQEWCRIDPDFEAEVKEARAEAAIRMMAHIQRAAPQDWRAAARMLEMMHPGDFNSRVEVTGAEGGPITVDYRGQLLEKLAQLALQEGGKDKASEVDDADGTEEGSVASPFVGLSESEGSNGSDPGADSKGS